MDSRPAIPAEMKRQILVEAGHRCAIPTCRFPTTEIAHINPWSEVRNHEPSNLIALCPNCHTRFDHGEIDKKAMRVYKQKLIFISDRYSLYELNVLNYLAKAKKVVINGELAVQNLLDDGLVRNANTISYFTYDDGTKDVMEFVVALTKVGEEFLKDWVDMSSSKLTYQSEIN